MELREASLTLGNAFDIVVKNHNKLKGSKEKVLEEACSSILLSVSEKPKSILGPICEQLTRTTSKKRRLPYLNVAVWIHEKLLQEFDNFIIKTIQDYAKNKEDRRVAMGVCILIRSLAIVSCASRLLEPLSTIIGQFTSENPSLFEMEFFNTFIFIATVKEGDYSTLKPAILCYITWFQKLHPISSVSAHRLLIELENDYTYNTMIDKLRTDIAPSSDNIKQSWTCIAAKPFDDVKNWVLLGLQLGRFEDERIRSEIANISSEKGQFSSIISVALSTNNDTIREVARSIFRFGIHGQEAAAFDPNSLSQILEQSDDLTGIALTFLSEMALANAKECLPQLFPLLSSDKPVARKNALSLLQKVVDGHVGQEIRQMICANLLPMIGDESITVRVDIPKLFSGVKPQSVVPSLIKMLGDSSEKKRSTATECLKKIMQSTEEPEDLLRVFLDTALNPSPVPLTPGSINPITKEDEKCRDRSIELVNKWAQETQGRMMLDPNPVLNRLWNDPQNSTIASFIAKASPMFDKTRLLAAVLTKLREKHETVFDGLAPLLVLQGQPVDFFLQRDVVASPLFDLLMDKPKDEISNIVHLRGDIIARFNPNFVIPQLIDRGLEEKFHLYIICRCGMIHEGEIPNYLFDEIKERFEKTKINDEMFMPYCDSLYFSEKEKYLEYAMNQTDTNLMFTMVSNAFQKFNEDDARKFIKTGKLGKLLNAKFDDEYNAAAVNALFLITFQARSEEALEPYWDQLFDIMAFFSDSKNADVRFASMKLLGALITNPAMQTHLIHVHEKFQHIVEIHTYESEDPRVRKIAQTYADMMKPQAKIQEI
ncbi:hypothetical protein TVAG_171970 [Trichomonas vaginalis G3]|uniref:HEAT repeat family protein n=1 Tax=Trichomonas vaginalis (strain ATCC PRA-98 / G3) TaxID=412133 RepID=A2DEU8_TRIV3|nr:armadillo (ARM) repeat-containing protein family [Trichomonas vaginalis G3]EAY20940.1 hypothetical protein TVAG_171970 [Trichomonas vaginalis G3]KAI5519099.1 armadillo (ARM) repeat-containing protein family [Trichomonas vaginalis G3]|eukprot:XP_001581926.1 hypothetical protein [Trichomonas vaginalis G3]